MPAKWKVLLIDDHPVVLFGLRTVLESDERFLLCGEARDAVQARQMAEAEKPDVIVLDLILGGRDGLELLKELRAARRPAAILVFSAQPEMIYARRAFSAGAAGYLMKDEGVEKVPEALAALMKGEHFASARVQRAMFEHMAGGAKPGKLGTLSDRELQVFRLLGTGLGTAQIAAELRVSMKTIGTYRERLKNKLAAGDSGELLLRAGEFVRNGRL